MRKTDIEYWALDIAERVAKRQPVEDSRVEVKSEWIEPVKAARRIAGHANAARGEPILWIFGLDEQQGATGIDQNAFSSWYSTVVSQFDGTAPESTSIAVPYRGLTLLALLFETDRAPFVVKNPSGGLVQFEVPWRDGTAIRSAGRAELIQLLVPLQRLPVLQLLAGLLRVYLVRAEDPWQWHASLQLYVASLVHGTVVIPFHQCSATLQVGHHLPETPLVDLALRPPPLHFGLGGRLITADTPRPQPDSLTIDGTRTELIVQGPGKFELDASVATQSLAQDLAGTEAVVRATLRPVESDLAIHLEAHLNWDPQGRKPNDDVLGRWIAVRTSEGSPTTH